MERTAILFSVIQEVWKLDFKHLIFVLFELKSSDGNRAAKGLNQNYLIIYHVLWISFLVNEHLINLLGFSVGEYLAISVKILRYRPPARLM